MYVIGFVTVTENKSNFPFLCVIFVHLALHGRHNYTVASKKKTPSQTWAQTENIRDTNYNLMDTLNFMFADAMNFFYLHPFGLDKPRQK